MLGAGHSEIAVSPERDMRDLRTCALSDVLVRFYRQRRCRTVCKRLALCFEGGQYHSATLRRILAQYHGVRAGAYSYGTGLCPGAFPPGVVIGRYVSTAADVRVFLRNHPLDRLSLHPFFYNSDLGYVAEDNIPSGALIIEADAWLGDRTTITPGCHRIGLGAVVGASAVVTKDVPDFAIVVGNPARLLRFRFAEATRELIRASRWWELPVQQVVQHLATMTSPLGRNPAQHPLLRDSEVRHSFEVAQCD